mmetsp:Transcript_1480/g.3350  ORF Transcript_1480/g.3350 Transcript_1480/m.3350 type:complete len:530 (-) Transcript_1480:217-1806(-)
MKIFPNEVLSVSAIELSRRLHSREITAVELLQTTLDRIDDVNPKLRAIIALRKDRENLLQEALEADFDLDYAAANTDRRKQVGWLRGIPLAIKDLFMAKGIPTTLGGCPLFGEQSEQGEDEGSYKFGNWSFENEVEDEPYVGRLRDAGAIIIGKTNAPELGMGCHSYNTIHGTTLNPYNLSVTAGGSSGGAAAAIASKMLVFSDGSDMMGSLRNPAGWNNLYSIRPTAEWMSENTLSLANDGEGDGSAESIIELTYPISSVGPMARCPEDLAMFLGTLLPKEQTDFDASFVTEQSLDELTLLVKKSTIGWLADWGGSLPYENGVLSHCKRTLDIFGSLGGASVECIPDAPFPNEDLWDSWMTIRSHSILNSLRGKIGCDADEVVPTLKARCVKAEAIWECERGECLTRQQLERAVEKVNDWSVCADSLFQSYDFLALPSSQVYPFDASMNWPTSIAGKKMDTYHRWMNVMVPVTLLGAPCLTIPAGMGSTNGLPMGIQIFAQKGKDAQLLQLARWYYRNSEMKDIDLAV